MGMQFNPMYQPTSTKTITVDGDLNLNPYDVLAVDGKFDTVEADEFVGGVGNFSSLTSAGNIVLNGDTDVKGLLHAEDAMQIDGDLVVEGAINNVNITAEGAISTSKSVTATGGFKGNVTGNVTGSISGGTVAGSTGTFSGNVTGAKFNGVVLKSSGTITVTPNNTIRGYLPEHASSTISSGALTILPPKPSVLYSGSLKFKNATNDSRSITYWTGSQSAPQSMNITSGSSATISFNNVSYVVAHANNTGYVQFYDFTFS